ncbi:MAG: hemin uptake protein HemP [Paracoccaceae bacterium]
MASITESERRAGRSGAEPAGAPVVDTAELLGADGRLCIRHAGALYLLRVTRAGKLILTK